MESIKAFFQKTWVKIVAWVLLAISIIALVIGGATKANIDSYVVLVIALIAGVSAIVAFITNCVKSDK